MQRFGVTNFLRSRKVAKNNVSCHAIPGVWADNLGPDPTERLFSVCTWSEVVGCIVENYIWQGELTVQLANFLRVTQCSSGANNIRIQPSDDVICRSGSEHLRTSGIAKQLIERWVPADAQHLLVTKHTVCSRTMRSCTRRVTLSSVMCHRNHWFSFLYLDARQHHSGIE